MKFISIFILTVIALGNFAFAEIDFLLWKRGSETFEFINQTSLIPSLTSNLGSCSIGYSECYNTHCCQDDTVCAPYGCCPAGSHACASHGCCYNGYTCLSNGKCRRNGGSGSSSKESSKSTILISVLIVFSVVFLYGRF